MNFNPTKVGDSQAILAEVCAGYKARLRNAGFSVAAAEAMTVEFHKHILVAQRQHQRSKDGHRSTPDNRNGGRRSRLGRTERN